MPSSSKRFYFVGVSRGVIVLAQRVEPYQIRLLNPITHKSNTEFQAHIPSDLLQSVIVTKSLTMVFVSTDYPDHIAWADESTPTGQINGSFGEGLYSPPPDTLLVCMTAFRGEVYALLENGDILSTNIQLEQRASTVTMAKIISAPVFEQVRGTYKFYLVESDGDLLLVLNGDFAKGQPVLYRVDTENRSLEAVGDIGSRALFVDYNRSISIDTRLHPTVKPGCIYYMNYIRLYDHEVQAWEEEPTMTYGLSLEHTPRPYPLDEILAAHCRRREFSEYVLQHVGAAADEIYRGE
jgi:hypothetical protein